MKVALFGGSFNPITKAHIYITEYIIEKCEEIDEVWFVPTYKNIWNKKLIEGVHRLNMCKITIKRKDIKVCDIEIKNKLEGGTIDILKRIFKEYPMHTFYFLIGMDNADNITSWKNYKEILQIIPFIVVSRNHINIKGDKWYKNNPHIFFNIDAMDISSTQFRNKYIKDENVNNIIDSNVLRYIQNNNLYLF